jgi:replicative DNA helicase
MNEEKQERILAFLVQSKTRDLLFPFLSDSFFESPRQKAVYKILQSIWKKKSVAPTKRELRSFFKKACSKETALVQKDWLDRVDGLYSLDVTDATLQELAEDISRQEILRVATESVSDKAIGEVIDDAKKKIDSLSNLLGSSTKTEETLNLLSTDYLKQRAVTMSETPKDTISLGYEAIDKASGGLYKGELAVVMAPVNTGKTMFLVNIAVNLLEQGYRVLFLNCDTVRNVVERRLYACITGISMNTEVCIDELHQAVEDWKVKTQFQEGNFLYRQVVPHTLTISMMKGMIRQISDKYGMVDVVVLDYGDQVLPDRHYNEMRHQVNGAFDGLRALAVDLGILVVTATQTNKTAMKMKKTEVSDLDQIAEGFGKTHPMALCMIVNQTPAERSFTPPVFRVHIGKVTHGEGKGLVIPFVADYSRARIRQDTEGLVQKCMVESDDEDTSYKKPEKEKIKYGNDKYDPAKPKKKFTYTGGVSTFIDGDAPPGPSSL